MNTPPDQPPPAKPKQSAEERRIRQADRLITIRLRMLIGRQLEERGIITPAAIGAALDMSAAEATSLLTRHQWAEGNVARLQAAPAHRKPAPNRDCGKLRLRRDKRGIAGEAGRLDHRWRAGSGENACYG